MKYAIIIPEGISDRPMSDLDGLTPMEVANTPNLDKLAVIGRLGTVVTIPDRFASSTDVGMMTLLGYDPGVNHFGRAPLEAIPAVIDLLPSDWVFRCNLVTMDKATGKLIDHTAQHISSNESVLLLKSLAEYLADNLLLEELTGLEFVPGIEHKHLFVDRSGRDYRELETVPPTDTFGQALEKCLPRRGKSAELLRKIMLISRDVFVNHEVNLTRRELGELPVTQIWLWGQGQLRKMQADRSLQDKHGLTGVVISDNDLLAGLAYYFGWDVIPPVMQSGNLEAHLVTSYRSAVYRALNALDDHDIICIFVKEPDTVSHRGDYASKISTIEIIDKEIVGPVYRALCDNYAEQWRMLVMPSHSTLVSTRKHDGCPVPFLMGGHKVSSLMHENYNEKNAVESDLHIVEGYQLMEYFLFSGLHGRR